MSHRLDLGDMRRSYPPGTLDESRLAATWLEQFETWLAEAIDNGVVEPNAMVLATADPSGRPSARTVLSKSVDERGFVLYTNLDSRKGREALADPWASLVFPWHVMRRQVVVRGAVERVSDAEADAYFATRPYGARLGAHASRQSAVIASRAEVDTERAALEARWPEGTDVPRPPHWGGLRVVPDEVEFWQGRPDRLHDRLRYRLAEGGAWVVERLAP